MQDTDFTQLFVYGTLMRGEPNHRLMCRAEFVRQTTTAPTYELIHLGSYPALIPGGQTGVAGEVYRVDPRTLRALDRLEGHPHLYCRMRLRLFDGEVVEGYLMQPRQVVGWPRIATGTWRTRRNKEVHGADQNRGR